MNHIVTRPDSRQSQLVRKIFNDWLEPRIVLIFPAVATRDPPFRLCERPWNQPELGTWPGTCRTIITDLGLGKERGERGGKYIEGQHRRGCRMHEIDRTSHLGAIYRNTTQCGGKGPKSKGYRLSLALFSHLVPARSSLPPQCGYGENPGND